MRKAALWNVKKIFEKIFIWSNVLNLSSPQGFPQPLVEKLWKTCSYHFLTTTSCGKLVENLAVKERLSPFFYNVLWKTCGNPVENYAITF